MAVPACLGQTGDMPRRTIDRLSEDSFTNQLKLLIIADLRAGRWKVGTQMLSEAQFMSEYVQKGEPELSRVTVRRALKLAEEEGWVRGLGGRGWFALANTAAEADAHAKGRPGRSMFDK